MLFEERPVRDSLVRITRTLTRNKALAEDLLQEALVHLWHTEARRPGQTRSWYLQSCKYYLCHYLATGRSVDSRKRDRARWELTPVEDGDELFFPDVAGPADEVFSLVSARDLTALLAARLKPDEKAVLVCFADGLGPREIGRKLEISHSMVINHRRKIASMICRLDPDPALIPRADAGERNGRGRGRSGSRELGEQACQAAA